MSAAAIVPVQLAPQSGAAAATAAVAPPSAAAPRLDAEKLAVYHVALELQAMTPPAPQAPAVHVLRPCAPQPEDAAPKLDAERLTVYHVALELQAMTPLLVPAHQRVLHDQLERASLSAVLNIAEGAGRHSRRDKRRHYAIARGSAMETAAAIDVVRLRRLAPEVVCDQARSLALRVIQMLSKLSDALAP